MKVFKTSQLDELAEIVKNGGVIAFPTETVFGLGVIFDDEEAHKKLIAVKRRPPEKPFSLMLADPEDVEKYCELTPSSRALVKAFMPGQFTMVTIAKKGLPAWCVGQTGYIGVRVPDCENIRVLLRKIGKPMLVPSANKSGEAPANSVEEVIEHFEGELDGVLEGTSTSKIPSTVVLVEKNYTHVSREGVVTIEQIKKVLKKEAK